MMRVTQIQKSIELKFWNFFQYLVIHYPAMKSLIRWIYKMDQKFAWRKTKLGKDMILGSFSFLIGSFLGYFIYTM